MQPAGSLTIEVGRPGAALRGVAGDGTLVFAALSVNARSSDAAGSTSASHDGSPTGSPSESSTTTSAVGGAGAAAGTRSTIEARRGERVVWQVELDGTAGPLAVTGELLIATLAGGPGPAAGIALRGSPGAVISALDARTGAARWTLAIDSSEWSVVTAVAAVPGGGVLVAGSFSGTLRAAAKVVSSGGSSDGFVARLGATGAVEWLVRMGGPGADAIQGVAAAGDRIAIAGTFAAGADLLGTPLKAFDERSPNADGFVAELEPGGAVRWAQTFGGKRDDAVAGVAIDARGRIVVAATAREVVHVNDRDLLAQGAGDALIASWGRDGVAGTVRLVGGTELDGLSAIVAAGDRVVVAGYFSGALRLGEHALSADGGDDALLFSLDGDAITAVWPITGEGREEIASLAAVPGGFIAGVAHTARAAAAGVALPAPTEPMAGAALVVRPVR